jgi:methylmalonyl-CoA mutase N-terminal domain/subunit
LKVDPRIEVEQCQRVQAFRRKREETRWKASLEALQSATQGKENLVPYIKNCILSGSTVGEISHALRKIFGVYREQF